MNKKNGYSKLKIGGKSRPVKFGTNSDILYCEKRDCSLAEKDAHWNDIFPTYKRDDKGEVLKDSEDIPQIEAPPKAKGFEFRDLLYCGLVDGARYERTHMNANYNDLEGVDSGKFDEFMVGDWIDQSNVQDRVKLVLDVFSVYKNINIKQGDKKKAENTNR